MFLMFHEADLSFMFYKTGPYSYLLRGGSMHVVFAHLGFSFTLEVQTQSASPVEVLIPSLRQFLVRLIPLYDFPLASHWFLEEVT